VVGSCADGYHPEANTFGDVIFGDSGMEVAGSCPVQHFWELTLALALPYP
jgi:hypothetical protein